MVTHSSCQTPSTTQAMDAEQYYVTMIKGDDESWNVRDLHMQSTLERLVDFYGA